MRYVYISVALFFMQGCIGSFNTNNSLQNEYIFAASDENIAIFYNVNGETMSVAVKNVGYAFLTALNVSFACNNGTGNNTASYPIGSLKPYFSKQIIVTMNYNACEIVKVEYVAYAQPDGGFIYSGQSNFPPNASMINNVIEGSILLK